MLAPSNVVDPSTYAINFSIPEISFFLLLRRIEREISFFFVKYIKKLFKRNRRSILKKRKKFVEEISLDLLGGKNCWEPRWDR